MAGTCAGAGRQQNPQNDIKQEAIEEKEEGQNLEKVGRQRPGSSTKGIQDLDTQF